MKNVNTIHEEEGMTMLCPRKRAAIDGKTWWIVYDSDLRKYSTFTCFGKYRTKKACQIAIDHYASTWR